MVKRHLYLAVYDDTRSTDRGLRIHWALILAPPPKHEHACSFEKSSIRYHATNKNGYWRFERKQVECVRTPSMLGRIRLGVVDEKWHLLDVDDALRDPHRMRVDDPGWDCRVWVEEVLVDLVKERKVELRRPVQLDHLFEFGQRFGEEVMRRGLNTGFDIPITVDYPGPGSIPDKIIK